MKSLPEKKEGAKGGVSMNWKTTGEGKFLEFPPLFQLAEEGKVQKQKKTAVVNITGHQEKIHYIPRGWKE